jgi:hypothetical protein
MHDIFHAGLPIVCKAYANPPDHHDQHKSLNESHIQGRATHVEFTVPPFQCQRVIGWEPIGSDAIASFRQPQLTDATR